MTPTSDHRTLTSCGGAELRAFVAGGLAALERCATAIDRLNVFPVPDGDTGTNLARTIADALRDAGAHSEEDIGAAAAALASAALRHARGNSGAIFAQLCAGLAQSLAGASRADARAWADAWVLAAHTARRSVSAPVDGTILSAASAAADAAHSVAANGGDLLGAWRAMANAADAAVAETPRQLSVLERAGVVDAGALGLALFLRGGACAFTGEPLPDPSALVHASDATRRVIAEATFPRYCTQFLLDAAGAERTRLATRLATFGDSLDIVETAAEATAIRIHIHTDDPEGVVAYAATVGAVSGLRVEDMQRQREMLLAGDDEPRRIAMLALASGEGMRRLFASLSGVAAVVDGDRGLDAVVADIRRRAADAPDRTLLVLANDVRLPAAAAELAATGDGRVVIVPTRDAPEGVAAALAFDPDASPAENVRLMLGAARRVRTVCVARATDPDGRITARWNDETLASVSDLIEATDAALAALAGARCQTVDLITLYAGAGVSPRQVEDAAARCARRFPGVETEVIVGGQHECLLWIAVEGDVGPHRH